MVSAFIFDQLDNPKIKGLLSGLSSFYDEMPSIYQLSKKH